MGLIGLLILLAIIAYVRGWFRLSRHSSAAEGPRRTEWTLSVNDQEVEKDAHALRETLSGVGRTAEEAETTLAQESTTEP